MSKKIIITSNAPAPIGPYSQAIQAGNTLYVSGQVAFEPASGNLITDTIQNETHRVMKNIEAILTEAGYGFSDIVKCSIFVKDLNNFAAINEVYSTYVGESKPARETVEVSRLPRDVNVEISCIAVK
ncbi:MAG: RidA family protein [Cytophagales bacterium]|nr:RidA family protein [Cytophaga sp.]